MIFMEKSGLVCGESIFPAKVNPLFSLLRWMITLKDSLRAMELSWDVECMEAIGILCYLSGINISFMYQDV